MIVIADPHVHSYSTFDKDGSRLANCIKLLNEVFELARKEGIGTIVCCGDFFDKPVLPAVVVNEAAKAIANMPKGVRFLTISGNHDMFTTPRFGEPKGTAVRYLSELSDRFVLFDEISVALEDGAARVWGIPYFDDKGEYALALEAAAQEADVYDEPVKLLVIHQTPNGIGNAMIQTDTDPNDPMYDRFDLVLCGHIHQQQWLTEKFLVVGTPIHRSAEDMGYEKGYFIVDLGEGMKAKDRMKFVSTKGRYPEFVLTGESEAESERQKGNYVTVRPAEVKYKTDAASVEDFGTGSTPSRMVEAYWKEAGEGDEKLLKVGLKLLQGT